MTNTTKYYMAKIDINKITYRKLVESDIDFVIALQKDVIDKLPEKDLLRENTVDMFLECLNLPHYSIGAFFNDKLIALSILYYPHNDEETLVKYLDIPDINDIKSANYKLVMVSPNFRGNDLQIIMEEKLVEKARKDNVELLAVTVSPKNDFSKRNIEKSGYKFCKELTKYGFDRLLYYKYLVN